MVESASPLQETFYLDTLPWHVLIHQACKEINIKMIDCSIPNGTLDQHNFILEDFIKDSNINKKKEKFSLNTFRPSMEPITVQ